MCVLARDGTIASFDEGCERMTGWAESEVLGRDARDVVIPPDERDAFTAFLADVWRHGMSSPQVGHWLTRTGERRLVSWSNRPMFDDETGEMTHLFTVGIDLTERERANEELRAVHEELARRLDQVERLAAEQSSLRRVALLVAADAEPAVVFDAVAREIAEVLGASSSAVARYEDDGTASFVGRWGSETAFPASLRLDLHDDSAIARVRRTGEATWISSYDEVGGDVSERMLRHGYRTAAAAPVTVGGEPWGAVVVVAADPDALPEGSAERLVGFAQVVSLGLASADARDQLLASRKRLLTVADEERRRLERDLHDGAQQRLVAIGQRLHLAQRFLEGEQTQTREQLEISAAEVREAIEDLRRLANGLHPPILGEAGLRPALVALARRSALPVTVGDFGHERYPAEVETAAYYLVSEALTNTAKHAEATAVTIDVRRRDGRLVVTVADDGRGGANPASGSGLRGLEDRVEAVGGTLAITSSRAGTTIRAELPVEG